MSLPSESRRPFPLPLVAASPLPVDDGLEYLSMPQGMDTYCPPSLPDDLSGHDEAHALLSQLLIELRVAAVDPLADIRRLSLRGLPPPERALLDQLLGEGEVSARLLPDAEGRSAEVQEAVFAGVWRVVEHDANGLRADYLEVGAVPQLLRETALADAPAARDLVSEDAVLLDAGAAIQNARPLLVELQDHAAAHRPGAAAQVVNLSLLPLTPQDIAYLDHRLGTGRVLILSRGYGNCRITDTCTPHTWRVVYYNSADTVILNCVEVSDFPDVACAAAEDLADSAQRLAEVLEWLEPARAEG
ncbi:MAG: hydrogenase expression/formation protein [Roseateles depolymerans]|uniref:Hydrogenase expression/formation protein n=1 Tax=Roseateles depolymerans TaxID=76731 RepID=A0A2W5DUT9_9BURK|nr:MAG: hydrogenase expression/formation protein [Roseateles depolymerans]